MTADRTTRDPGLQPERTQLAWWRLALAVSAGTAFLLRYTTPRDPLTVAAAAVLAVAALATLYCARLRGRALPGNIPAAAAPRLVLAVSTVTTVGGAATLVLVLN